MRNIGRVFLLGLALSALLLLPAAAEAGKSGKAPSLASTSQYKAFVEYVKKLDGLAGKPTPAAKKESYEAELSTKKEAASHKANALFKRQSEEAQAEANAKAKEQTEAVRRSEEGELEELAAEFAAKLERATSGYQAKLENAEGGRTKFEARTHGQIEVLRGKKAKSKNPEQKTVIQEHIAKLIAEIQVKREETATKRTELKAAFGQKKEEIKTGEAKKETTIGEEAEVTVEEIATHWKKSYNAKKATLNAKRESQLAYLLTKLEKGRADIASQPVSG
jgi:hypothetical protein